MQWLKELNIPKKEHADTNSLCDTEEDRASIDVFPVAFRHGLCSRFWRKYTIIAISFQLWQEELVELISLNLLGKQQQQNQ